MPVTVLKAVAGFLFILRPPFHLHHLQYEIPSNAPLRPFAIASAEVRLCIYLE